MLAAAVLVLIALADKPPSRRDVAAWCIATDGSPDAMRCDDYIFSVANLIDRSRLSMAMPQCIPAAAKPANLRRLAATALSRKGGNNPDGPAAIVAGAFVDAFGCTSDPKGKRRPVPPPGRPLIVP